MADTVAMGFDPNQPFAIAPIASSPYRDSAARGNALDPGTTARAMAVYSGLRQRGMDYPSALGYAANAVQESRADPSTRPGDRGASHGTFMWAGPRYDRYVALHGHTPEQGDLDEHLDYLMWENQGPEADAWRLIQQSAPDPAARAAAISTHWERPKDTIPEEGRRSWIARQLMGSAQAATPKRGGFDPNQPFQMGAPAQKGFDPNQPFEVLGPVGAEQGTWDVEGVPEQAPSPETPTPEASDKPNADAEDVEDLDRRDAWRMLPPAPLDEGNYKPSALSERQTSILAVDEWGNPINAQAPSGPPDITGKYNTALTPDEQTKYQAWLQEKGMDPTKASYDYDMQGAFKAGVAQSDNGHFPDTFKKPNHPTFSDQSQYNGVEGQKGGHWTDLGEGKWSFDASPTNVQMHGADALQGYFANREAGNILNLPRAPSPTMQHFGWSADEPGLRLPEQSYPAGVLNAGNQAVVAGTGHAISGFGEAWQAGQIRAGESVLRAMDQVDQGDVAAAVKPLTQIERGVLSQYIRANPEDRQRLKTEAQTEAEALAKRDPNMVARAGQEVTRFGLTQYPVNPENVGIGTEVAGAIGGVIPLAAAGVAGSLVGGPAGAIAATLPIIGGQTYHTTLQEARQSGATSADAEKYAGISALTQMGIMALPIGRVVRATPELAAPLAQAIVELGKRGVEFGSFAAVSKFADNFVAHETFDPKRELMEGVPEAAAVGALAGGAMAVPGTLRGRNRSTAAADEGLYGVQPQPPVGLEGPPPESTPSGTSGSGLPPIPPRPPREDYGQPRRPPPPPVTRAAEQANELERPRPVEPVVEPKPAEPQVDVGLPEIVPEAGPLALPPPSRPVSERWALEARKQALIQDQKKALDYQDSLGGPERGSSLSKEIAERDAEMDAIGERLDKLYGIIPPGEPPVRGKASEQTPQTQDVIEHTTDKGKVLRGVVRTDLTQAEAKAIDKFTFRKDGGWFIREQYLKPTDAALEAPPAPVTPEPGQRWVGVGKNADGNPVFEDANGVRSFTQNGLRTTETVQVRPTRAGMKPSVAAVGQKEPEFEVAREPGQKPAEHPGLVIQSLETGKQTVIQPPGTVPPGTTPSQAVEPITPTGDPDHQFADILAKNLSDPTHKVTARDLQALGQRVYGGTLGSAGFTRDRLYDAIELGVNRYIQQNPERFAPTGDPEQAKAAAAELAALKDRIPTQTVRAGEKDTHQQFSTPPDYAYSAAWVANMRPTDRVLEPSAGTGGLIVHAMNAGVQDTHVNELSEKRRSMLGALKPGTTHGEDATQLHNILPDTIKPTVVLMNPPFSVAAGRMGNKMVLGEGARHVEQALERLEPGGRLVAIVGDGMRPAGSGSDRTGRRGGTGEAFRDWWRKIGTQYDVRANLGVEGDIFRKYGTTFPTRILVIDKVPPSGRKLIDGSVKTAGEIIDALKGIRDERADQGGAVQPVASEPTGVGVAPAGAGTGGTNDLVPGATGVVGPGPGRGNAPANPSKPAGPEQPGTGGERTPAAGKPTSGPGNTVVSAESEPKSGGTDIVPGGTTPTGDIAPGSGPTGVGSGIRPDGSGERDEPGVTPPPELTVKTETAVTEPHNTELTEAVYEAYTPQRVKIEGSKPHPGALVQSAAMASVQPPKTDYRPRIAPGLIKSGALSDAQLEAVVYAGHAHDQMLPAEGAEEPKRRGFYVGDSTGVGKGREIAGIILDNWNQGRKKAIWVSENLKLLNDAKRDWSGIGRDPNEIVSHQRVKASDPIKLDQGILFTGYDTLKSAEQLQTKTTAGKPAKGKTRVDQIVDWVGKDFDGVIAFDEAHNMANAIPMKGVRGTSKPSAKALAGVELQARLPNARIVYVSATGATEVSNLAYADRLGLWGRGTPFPNRNDFLSKINQGGIAGMELVARDMKALGHYIARSLSYDGVEYNRLEHKLSGDQRVTYDKLAEGWQVVLRNFEAAIAETNGGKKARSAAMAQFWGTHQRFFNQIITSMQMPTVIKSVEKDIKEGRQAVLQLVNTMEAAQERAVEKAKQAGEDLEDLDMTPRDQLMQMIEKSFPVQQWEDFIDENGNEGKRPVVDAKGNPVLNKTAVAMRERLLDQLGSLRVPDGPLEILFNAFGVDKVAEVTGRGQRVVRKPDETGQIKTMLEKRGADANISEANDFQEGKKPILVFSQAGGTGRSYHAAIGSGSEKMRRAHYLVQAGWRADKAVQGFGRTHRTNQASAPIFHLVTTDLDGQKRFISSIARRLGQLGALTKGERRTGDQGLFGLKDNLESGEARTALESFFKDLDAGKVPGLTIAEIERSTGLKLRNENGGLEVPQMSQFLNRLLSFKVDEQNMVFREFADRLDTTIDRAAAAGTLDTGLETYKADRIDKKGDTVVYTDPNSGAETRHVQLEAKNRNHPASFEDVMAGKHMTGGNKPRAFVQNRRSGRIYALTDAHTYTNKDGAIIEQYRLTSPLDYQFIDRTKVNKDNWNRAEGDQAKDLWDKQVAATPEYRTSDIHLITGAVLPIWDRLGGSPKIFRLQTSDGERMLGRVIPDDLVDQTLESLGAEKLKVNATPAQIAAKILDGGVAHLANGWTIKRSLVGGEQRLELVGPSFTYDSQLKNDGVFAERIDYKTRYFIPSGEQASSVIEKITSGRPVTQLTGGRTEGGGSGKLYSFPGMLFDPDLWRGLGRGIRTSQAFLRDRAKTNVAARQLVKVGQELKTVKGGIQTFIAPMSTGGVRAQAQATKFANALRNVTYHYGLLDRYIVANFKPPEREAMGRAMDNQSVFEQQLARMDPDTRRAMEAHDRGVFDAGGTGVAGLPPKQRELVEILAARAQEVWEDMRAAAMVGPEAQGLPYYFARQMVMMDETGTITRTSGAGGVHDINRVGENLTTRKPMRREHLTPEETEAAAKAVLGDEVFLIRDIRSVVQKLSQNERAVAGTNLLDAIKNVGEAAGEQLVIEGEIPTSVQPGDYFTLNHPAFRRYAGSGSQGQERGVWKQIHIANEFKGPLEAILSTETGKLFESFMKAKGATMHAIMWSPLMHLGVEMGRAFPLMPGKIASLKFMKQGADLRTDDAYMAQAIKDGLAPIAQGWSLDPVRIAEDALTENPKTWVGKAWEWWKGIHQKYLWDNVFNLQVTIYDHMKKKFDAKGFDPRITGTMAAHLANRFAGALPAEHLSKMANQLAHITLFSRSFTLGNLGVMKDVLSGLPSHLKAQMESLAGEDATRNAVRRLRKVAFNTMVIDMAVSFFASAIVTLGVASAVKALDKDAPEGAVRDVWAGWLDDAQESLSKVLESPLNVLGVFPQHHNEPGKRDRALIGHDIEGRGVYFRPSVGKVGEEFMGWLLWPGTLFLNKLSPLFVKPMLEVINGEDAINRKILKPEPQTALDMAENAGKVVQHFVNSFGPIGAVIAHPMETYSTLKDIFVGGGTKDRLVQLGKMILPATGTGTISVGYPGGEQAGFDAADKRRVQYNIQKAMPDVRNMVREGRFEDAERALEAAGADSREINKIIKYATPGNPGGSLRKWGERHGFEPRRQTTP